MRHRGRVVLTGALLLAIGASARGLDLESKVNLVEYSCNYFGEGGVDFQFVKPPDIKLYRDGSYVFRRDGQFLVGRISSGPLERLEKMLRRSDLLRQSSYRADLPGDPMLHHGGLCHFLYHEDDGDGRLIATPVVPRRGEWRRLVEQLEGLLPDAAAPYLPTKVVVEVEAAGPARHGRRTWPHEDRLDLAAATAGRTEVTDPEVVRTIFTDVHKRFVQADRTYWLELVAVPGWFDRAATEESLHRLLDSQPSVLDR